MLGILGTVTGIIQSFELLGGTRTLVDPRDVSAGIAEALITTAVGLIVGIPAMFAYFVFKSRYAKLTSRIARTCGDLHQTLVNAITQAHR